MSVGEGVVDNLADEIMRHCNHLNDKKMLLLTTDGLLNIYKNEVDKMMVSLPNVEIIQVKESSYDYAVELAKYISTNNIKLVLGLGGGTVLDTAKYSSFVSKTTYIAIPTTLSNDGLASPIAVLYAQNERKKSFGSKIADGLIIDTNIIAGAPKILLQAGVGDTLSNYTALYDWKLDCKQNGTKENDFAYMLSEMSFNALLYSQEKSLISKQCLKRVAHSLVISGLAMEIAGNSRPCSGSEHLFSHAIDELYDLKIPHGILVALGSVVACTLQGRNNNILLDYLKAYNISINPEKLSISKDNFIDAWLFAQETRKERYTVLNTIKLTSSMFSEIYDELMEVCK